MRNMARTCTSSALALLVLLTCSTASAGAWVRDLGSVYVKVGATFFSAEQSFARGVATDLAYESQSYRIYAEIGLPLGLQFVFDVPYVIATNLSGNEVEYHNNTFGDARFGFDLELYERVPVSVGVDIKVPLYESVSEQGDGGLVDIEGQLYPVEVFPAVGDDNIDITPKVSVGYGLQSWPAWVSAELGYRHRLGGFADSIVTAVNLGAFVWPSHIALGVYANANFNVQDDPNPDVKASSELVYVQGYVLVTAAPWRPELGLTLGVGRIVRAENAGLGTDYSVGVSYTW